MRYTDQDVEEVINAYFVSYRASKNARGQTADASTVHRKAHEQGVRAARAALEAMEREPIEDVLDRAGIYNVYVLSVTLSDGTDAWEAQIMEPKRDRRWATGATIDEAIRNAVNAANEGR